MDHYSSVFFHRTAGWNDRGALASCRGTASYTRGEGICPGTTNHRKWCGQLFGRFSWTHRGTISWKGVHPPFSWSSRILFHEIGKHHWVEKQYSLLLMNFDCVCSPKTTSFAGLFEEKPWERGWAKDGRFQIGNTIYTNCSVHIGLSNRFRIEDLTVILNSTWSRRGGGCNCASVPVSAFS